MNVELLSLPPNLNLPDLVDVIKKNGEQKACPIWTDEARTGAWLFRREPERPEWWYSPRGGGLFGRPWNYEDFPLIEENADQRLRIAASRNIFKMNRSGLFPLITNLDDLKKLARHPRLRIQDRIDELLRCVEERGPISQPTRWAMNQCKKVAEFTERCMAATECRDYDELWWLADAALEQGFLKRHPGTGYQDGTWYLLSGQGAMRLDRLRHAAPDSDRAFVAMWFGDGMANAWSEAIKPGLSSAGYNAVRIDRKEHVNRIDAEIEAEIRQARLIVADFTCGFADDNKTAIPRGGVYFEAGFAHGLGIPVIWTCREDHVEHLHFDTRQYNHLLWQPDELGKFREGIKHRVIAAVGKGPFRGDDKL